MEAAFIVNMYIDVIIIIITIASITTIIFIATSCDIYSWEEAV